MVTYLPYDNRGGAWSLDPTTLPPDCFYLSQFDIPLESTLVEGVRS